MSRFDALTPPEKPSFNELEYQVRHWAENKGIFDKSTALKQFEKTCEEMRELEEELWAMSKGIGDMYDLLSETGDVLVTLINMLALTDDKFTLTDCLEIAYNKISKRTGAMVDGKFVKDGGQA